MEHVHVDEWITKIKGYGAFTLSTQGYAACAMPDDKNSAGAALLESARDAFVEYVEYAKVDFHRNFDFVDAITEIADEQPSVSTPRLWTEFVDLGGYSEDISELLPEMPDDLDHIAQTALRIILERMLYAFVGEVTEAIQEDEDDALELEDKEQEG